MYGSGLGSFSGIIHLTARRPFVSAAVIIAAAVAVTTLAPTPVPPPPPVPPAVVTITIPTPVPIPALDPTVPTFDATCQFGTKPVVTNFCKASLDTVALWLQTNPTKSIVVRGSLKNVLGIRRYLTSGESKFGIASSRVSIVADDTTGNTVTLREQ
jgi:hypothetical protein